MIEIKKLDERVSDGNRERASNSYLMSMVAIIGGIPLPILNLLATLFFLLAHRKREYFVRWHCTQAFVSQLSVFLINTTGFWWTMSIIFGEGSTSNSYFAYIITAILFNIFELLATFYTAVKTRKGEHVSWWFYGDITDLIVKK